MNGKLTRKLKYALIILLNNIIIGMILGFIWYKLGLAKSSIEMSSGIDVLKIKITNLNYLYYFILAILEFIIIIIFKQLFKSKKSIIFYLTVSIIVSLILLFISSIGFDTGYRIINISEEIKTINILIACIGLRYKSWIFILNIPTILAILYINKKAR